MNIQHIILSSFLAIFLSVTTVFAQDYKTEYNVDDSKIALQGYSPVSYIDLGLAQRGSKAFKSEYEGISYYFTDEKQKNTFDANPQRYLPEFGGWCATGIAVGAKFRTDPNKFLVEDDKLYLFLYSMEVDAIQLWKADEKKLHAQAIDNWKKLRSSH